MKIKIRYFEKGLSKNLIWLDFFFWTLSFLMKKIMKKKTGLELVARHSLGYKTSSEKFLY